MGNSGKFFTILNFLLLGVLAIVFLITNGQRNEALDYTNRRPPTDISITCNNFKTQRDAQAFFRVYDNKGLDNDSDGIVCENLK